MLPPSAEERLCAESLLSIAQGGASMPSSSSISDTSHTHQFVSPPWAGNGQGQWSTASSPHVCEQRSLLVRGHGVDRSYFQVRSLRLISSAVMSKSSSWPCTCTAEALNISPLQPVSCITAVSDAWPYSLSPPPSRKTCPAGGRRIRGLLAFRA